MRLYVYVLEARDLLVKDPEALGDAYVKLQFGKYKSRTRVVRNNVNPVWNEEFVFRAHELDDELNLAIFHRSDNDFVFFNVSGDFLGRVRIPLRSVLAEENQTLPPTWFSLEKPGTRGRFTAKHCGKILLTLSLNGKCSNTSSAHNLPAKLNDGGSKEWAGQTEPWQDAFSSILPYWRTLDGKQLMKSITSRLDKLFNKNEENFDFECTPDDSSELSSTSSDYEDCVEDLSSSLSFEESVELMQARDDEKKMPDNLHGGILLDRMYLISPEDLNMLLFMPNSLLRKEVAEQEGTTDLQEEPWTWKSGDMSCLTRVVTYTKAASKLVKAVKATEEQTYLKADGREFAVFVSVKTPDVPYGNCFKVELLYKIILGPKLSSGGESTHLIVSWGMRFSQSTVMRSMIEGGVRQGVKESSELFADLLAQKVKPLDSTEMLDKENVLATLQTENQSDWDLGIEYFWNFTVVSTIFMCLYVLIHILLCWRGNSQDLEFNGLDLPDTFGEVITSGILVLQVERFYKMVSHFVQARLQRGSDHGLKAQGEGWILTVALIEGNN